MIKWIVGICLVGFTSYCGYFFAKKYRKRKLYFIQLYEFNERFINELSYFRRPLSAFIKNYQYKGEFLETLEWFFSHLREKSTANYEIFTLINEYDFLTDDEKRFVTDYFKMLGTSDSLSQKEYFSTARKTLLELKTKSETENEKLGGLYVKLGFLFGLTILIVIV